MKKHKTKYHRSAFRSTLDVLVTELQEKAIRKAAEDQGVNVSVLTRQVLSDWLREKGYLAPVERPQKPLGVFAGRKG